MNRKAIPALVLLLALVIIGKVLRPVTDTSPPSSQQPVSGDQHTYYKVIAVTDGDTIKVLYNGKEEKIRLNGIDCPEKKQAFGQKAKQFASDMVLGKKVRLVGSERDYFGRILADVSLPNGKSLCQELVKNGLAWHYKKYSKDKVLADLEIEARNAKIGLWADKDPVAPWDYRRKKKRK